MSYDVMLCLMHEAVVGMHWDLQNTYLCSKTLSEGLVGCAV